jgi:nitroreductase
MTSGFEKLMLQRRSVRAFLDDPVDRRTLEKICTTARRAPSGANLQPGKFHLLTGANLDALKTQLLTAHSSGQDIDLEYSYFPEPMTPVLKDRQRAAGYSLYGAQGIERRDVKGRREQFAQNYRFFDAPVGAIVTIDRNMGKGCFMDMGMAVMTFLLAAEDAGLGATGIGAIANYGAVVHGHLGLPEDEMVVCGIALGFPDMAAPINQFRTDRGELGEFTSFYGFNTFEEEELL